jgi:MFS transporter, DHA2 family, methylenomycin A resistance protein
MSQLIAQNGRRSPSAVKRPGGVLVAALLGFFMMALDSTAVNVALPSIGRSFGGSAGSAGSAGSVTDLQWVVDGYVLMFAALLISAGAASDRFGARRLYATGLCLFALASAACGLAPAMWFLIGARFVQGSAAALALPASLALIRQGYADPVARASAVARWTVGGAVAVAAGPVIGGVLTTAVSWRAIFFVNLPVAVLALALLLRVPGSPRRVVPLDLPGQVALVIALAALTYGIVSSRPALLLVSLGAVGVFVAVEARTAHPMLPLALFRTWPVTVCVVCGFMVNVAFYGPIFVFSLYFQRVLGMSAVAAGLMFAPMTALVSVANLSSARVAARFGPRLPIWTGQLVCAFGLFGLACTASRLVIVVLLVPVGLGLGFVVPSLTTMLLDAIPACQAGLAAGVLNSSRQLGGAVAVAVFGALVTHSFVQGMHTTLLITGALLLATAAAARSIS